MRRVACMIATVIGLAVAAPSTAEPTLWSGPQIEFAKPDFGDPSLPANQDAIAAGYAITRDSVRGIYNAAIEPFYAASLSPADTEWAWTLNNPALTDAEIRADNYAALHFDVWRTAHGGAPLATLGRPGVLHLISADIYLEIQFTSWTQLAGGGGFAYQRSTPQPPPVPALGAPALANAALVITAAAAWIRFRTARERARAGEIATSIR